MSKKKTAPKDESALTSSRRSRPLVYKRVLEERRFILSTDNRQSTFTKMWKIIFLICLILATTLLLRYGYITEVQAMELIICVANALKEF